MLFMPFTSAHARTKFFRFNRFYSVNSIEKKDLTKQINELKKELKNLNDDNNELKKVTKDKNQKVIKEIEKIDDGLKTVSSKKLKLIKIQLEKVKDISDEIKKTVGSVKIENYSFENNEYNNSLDEAVENLKNMIEIQEKRKVLLTKLNDELDILLNLLK